jgi:hypothetical protein
MPRLSRAASQWQLNQMPRLVPWSFTMAATRSSKIQDSDARGIQNQLVYLCVAVNVRTPRDKPVASSDLSHE